MSHSTDKQIHPTVCNLNNIFLFLFFNVPCSILVHQSHSLSGSNTNSNNKNSARPFFQQRRGCRLGVVGSNSNNNNPPNRQTVAKDIDTRRQIRRSVSKEESGQSPGPVPGYLTRRKPCLNSDSGNETLNFNNDSAGGESDQMLDFLSNFSQPPPASSQTFRLPLDEDEHIEEDGNSELSTSSTNTTMLSSAFSLSMKGAAGGAGPSCSYSAVGGERSDADSTVR